MSCAAATSLGNAACMTIQSWHDVYEARAFRYPHKSGVFCFVSLGLKPCRRFAAFDAIGVQLKLDHPRQTASEAASGRRSAPGLSPIKPQWIKKTPKASRGKS